MTFVALGQDGKRGIPRQLLSDAVVAWGKQCPTLDTLTQTCRPHTCNKGCSTFLYCKQMGCETPNGPLESGECMLQALVANATNTLPRVVQQGGNTSVTSGFPLRLCRLDSMPFFPDDVWRWARLSCRLPD